LALSPPRATLPAIVNVLQRLIKEALVFSITFDVMRSITIDKPLGDVYSAVSDFNTWRGWSPWLCQEPECPVEISGDPGKVGHTQGWDGKRIGTGSMRIAAAEANKSLDYDLDFLKPWKSRAKVGFTFEKEGGSTKITWPMQGSLPIFMAFMKKMMAALVTCDYDRGLSMLKELLETGHVPTLTKVHGMVDRKGFSYVGRRKACTVEDVGPSMEAVLCDLHLKVEAGQLPKPDFVFSIYHRYDMVKRECEYTTALGYATAPAVELPEGLVGDDVPDHRALHVEHIGSYRHLGNAWTTAMGCQRNDRLKPNKGIAAYEIYGNMPGEVEEKDVQTSIYLPVR